MSIGSPNFEIFWDVLYSLKEFGESRLGDSLSCCDYFLGNDKPQLISRESTVTYFSRISGTPGLPGFDNR